MFHFSSVVTSTPQSSVNAARRGVFVVFELISKKAMCVQRAPRQCLDLLRMCPIFNMPY